MYVIMSNAKRQFIHRIVAQPLCAEMAEYTAVFNKVRKLAMLHVG